MKSKKNIVLVGMMGSGKSVIGKILAKKVKLQFIDIDAKIEKNQKSTISEIFKKKGENYFREIELVVLFSDFRSIIWPTGLYYPIPSN